MWLALLLFQTMVKWANTYVTSWLGQVVIRDLRVKVYRFINNLKLRFFDQSPVGTLVTRAVSDVETISNIFSQGIITVVGEILQLITIIAVMFYYDWKLSLLCLSVLPLLIIASNVFRRAVKKSFQEVRNKVSELNAFVQEHITGMAIVQLFNRQEREQEKFERINRAHMKANIKAIFAYAVFFPVVEIITAVSIGLLVYYGGAQSLSGEVTPGIIVMFLLFIQLFFRPVRILADRFNTIQMGLVAANRIFALLDDKKWQERTDGSKKELAGKVQFDKVWFAYQNEEYVLKDISFDLKAGKTLALVGATGAGKSSIINLVSGFYPIQKGTISIDGMDLNDWELENLRSQMAIVLQDVFLFSGSIKDNITLSMPNVTEDKMRAAAASIGADKFIESLPDSYDYQVMERGSSLSTGQRQLISFIRAMAFDPKILILDEATSSVDSETEKLIQKATDKLMKGRTSIVIAHRLSTIRNVDEILVLKKGEIVERGKHAVLMAL